MGNIALATRLLVIEDSEVKWREIEKLITGMENTRIVFERAATMEQANSRLSDGEFELVLLDISMDIRTSTSGPRAGGHDATGGLKIAERMFYLGQDIPVVIVTAFDAFPSGEAKGNAVLGLEDVIREASGWLRGLLIGCVRYGEPGWEVELRKFISGVSND